MRRSRTVIPGFKEKNILGSTQQTLAIYEEGVTKVRGVVTKKKYKPVVQKVRSVVTQLPGWYRIIREIQGDPLEKMPVIEKVPPPFKPMFEVIITSLLKKDRAEQLASRMKHKNERAKLKT
jgi:hypothetical protein